MIREWNNKRVLVTGSSGVIGRVLVKLLMELDAIVLSVDLEDSESIEASVDHIQLNLAKEIPANLSNFQPQVVFHLAAAFERTVETHDYWKTSFENNALLSHRLLRVMNDISSLESFVFASSYLIYDPKQYLDVSVDHKLKETDNVRPRNLVGAAKYLFEQELDFIDRVEHRFRTVSARIYRVYGLGSRDVISRWVRSAIAGKTIEVFGEDNEFDFIFAGDVAEGMLRLAQASEARGVINLGSGNYSSIRQVVNLLESIVPGIEVQRLEREYQKEASAANMTMFQHLTAWLPQTTLEDGINKILEYEQTRNGKPV